MSGIYGGRVALVTGGGSGIGRATALAFARAGARVVVAGRSLGACEETARQIRDGGGASLAVACDVTSEPQVVALCERAVDAFGEVDAAFLNAGIGTAGAIVDQDVAEFDRVMAVNCTGLMLCLKHLLAPMYRRGTGAVVANLSVHAHRSILEGTSAYTASKHAAWAITKVAAIESARHGVRVNAVSPGPIHTDMLVRSSEVSGGIQGWAERLPMQRVGQPYEVAEAVLWLCSPSASFVNGAAIAVDGGFLAA
ncbi:SDR family oxidoreductase [Acidovorax sp. GBBC 3334]|uniref:SDR family NAD(P)-dependent oxidoreductase n=1 Tax=Acidovorax sp. GBBC 3334 TaxID=2940496 RepID=UPI0023030D7A|nr:SDR family oxidoreductase [Acidovorax sp. GBBC 3334]MDA8453247.1 SDR family oxidoreductase [Acidovorax sp. GBBC 3334]